MTLLRDSLISGALTAISSATAAMLLARREGQRPAVAVNAVSHWLWGPRAAWHDEVSIQYTATGAATNTAACVWWAGVYEWLRGRLPATPAATLAAGPAVAALAYVVDYHVVPARLTPGYELRLSNRSLGWLYVVIGLSLPVRALLDR
ncbi:MAG TPA: hypothetical protein VFB54_06760 [Burkholderiales bacterium]|nr:hypothetical protein [Burkholderiales bacterium]